MGISFGNICFGIKIKEIMRELIFELVKRKPYTLSAEK